MGLGVTPADMVTFYLAGTYGAEQNGIADGGVGAGSKRGVVTLNSVITATEQLKFVVDLVWGNESDLLPDANGNLTESGTWYGAAGYAVVQATDELSFALRLEVFDDNDGVRTGAPRGATIWEITPTVAYQIHENVLARFEYRHDEASDPIYDKGTGRTQSGSDTIAFELMGMF
jgi:hypothetical protein